MNKLAITAFSFLFISMSIIGQETQKNTKIGHTDQNKFRQLKDVLPTPNNRRTASGAPGYEYTQQKVDYVMNIRIDENTNRLFGDESITYKNNSKDYLEYLWVQLDQNMRAPDSKTPLAKSESLSSSFERPETFTKKNLKKPSDFGFKIEEVKNIDGSSLSYMINRTMMRINFQNHLHQALLLNLKLNGIT